MMEAAQSESHESSSSSEENEDTDESEDAAPDYMEVNYGKDVYT